MKRRDAAGLTAVLLVVAGLYGFRMMYFEPAAWARACAKGGPALICLPRAAIGYAQYRHLMGDAAALLGLWAFIGAPFAVIVAAVCMGAAGLIDYNITWGMLGACLGAWAWLTGGGTS